MLHGFGMYVVTIIITHTKEITLALLGIFRGTAPCYPYILCVGAGSTGGKLSESLGDDGAGDSAMVTGRVITAVFVYL